MSSLSAILDVGVGYRINQGATTGQFLRGNGTTFVSNAIQAADVPTLNQDTTGKSAKTDALNSATTVVNVAAATAPTIGQFLTAVDSTHATWQTFSATGNHNLTGTANQVVLSASGTNALLGSNDIVLSLPQSIATGSSVQFGGLGIGTAASAGLLTVLSSNATGLTTSAGLSVAANSLTTGTGLYIASSSVTGGLLVDIEQSGTVATNGQIAFNLLTTGANTASTVTTYGASFSNTHSGTGALNVAGYFTASGAAAGSNHAINVNAGDVLIGVTGATPQIASFVSVLYVQKSSANIVGVMVDNSLAHSYASFVICSNGTRLFNMTASDNDAGYVGMVANLPLILQTNNVEVARFPAAGGFEVSTGPLKIDASGAIPTYRNVVTAGWGVPAIYGTGRSTAQTAAVASVATYTVGAADGSFLVSANVNITTSTTYNFQVMCNYTDEGNTTRAFSITFSPVNSILGIAITNATGAGPYEGVPLHIRAKASTAITLATVGTFTSVTYDVEGAITQIA